MIERFYVQNYRCLESFKLDLSESSSTLIIGKNGSGKSTVRKALEILQTICRGSSRVDNLISPNDFSFNQTNRPMRFEIEAVLSANRYVYAIAFDWPANFREARILEEKLTVDGNNVFDRDKAQIRLPDGNGFGLDWHVFALSVINEKPSETSISNFKTFLATLILLAPVPDHMVGYSEFATNKLESNAANFASCLRGLLEKKPAAYGAFDAFVRGTIPDFSSIENEERGKGGKQLMVSFKRLDNEESLRVEFDDLSSGEKCFFLSAYIVASNSAGFPSYCFWDEPDNHLSMSEVGHFVTSLRKMAMLGGQFVATSHHPETVRKFSDETTVVLTRKTHLDPTLARRLSELKYNGDLIDSLIRDEVIG